ncbi:MAG: hypothetical protein EB059_00905 [Alphaproteobacteria bacterium]|nr:hypothetical protein [Alphaproteobacteria bacterium]
MRTHLAPRSSRTNISKEAGFNLIEAAIVLGIVGLIIGGIWAAASSAYENMRQQATSKNLLSLASNIRNFYAQSATDPVLADFGSEQLYQQGLVPSDMLAGNDGAHILRHQWGGVVDLAPSNLGGNVSGFTITLNNVSGASCRNLIMRNANAAKGSGLLGVGVGEEANILNMTTNGDDTVTQADLTTNCPNAGQVDVIFTFGIRG